MKQYVPNLIAERHRVLPDYFKEPTLAQGNPVASASLFMWNALAIALILIALLVVGVHKGFSLSLLTLAFISSGWGKQQLERGLQFTFTLKLKAATLGAVSLVAMLTGFQYQARLDQAEQRQRLTVLAARKAHLAAKRREAIRLDNLNTYLASAQVAQKQGAYARSIRLYRQSTRFVSANEPDQRRQLQQGIATVYIRTKQYKLAIEAYDELGTLDNETRYQQALCYQHLGQKTQALSTLWQAAKAGHQPATKLYNKLNPLLRKVLYYQTVCCDGSYSPSNAKGSGACSHHGGVCDWNFPIYETYRKYAVNDF